MDSQVVERKNVQNGVNNTHIRVLVIDDHVILRQGIREMLNKEQDLEVLRGTHSGGNPGGDPDGDRVSSPGQRAESPGLGAERDRDRVSPICLAGMDQ